MIKEILNPDLYHGHKKKKNYFEGWYFKLIDKDNKHSIAFIPGIIMGKGKKEGHSFIQVVDGINQKSYYIKYKKEQFNASKNLFYIEINKNIFSLNKLILNYHSDEIKLIGNLTFVNITKFPDSKINPGSMGFYNYLLFMECYSQVCVLDGEIIGSLLINDKEIDFTGGRVYIEKNWGKSFPQAYIWVQANGFTKTDTALSISIGKIPLWFYRFNGFLTVFKYNDKIYKFTTINRSKINIEHKKQNVLLSFEKNGIRLNVETFSNDKDFLLIKGPNQGSMDVVVKENVVSDIHVELMDLNSNYIIFQGVAKNAGIEFYGNLRELQK